jgi:hypothetical protein
VHTSAPRAPARSRARRPAGTHVIAGWRRVATAAAHRIAIGRRARAAQKPRAPVTTVYVLYGYDIC